MEQALNRPVPSSAPEGGSPFAQRLRRARRSAGLRQQDLAARLQVRQQTIGRWETGGALPQRRYWAALAELLNISPAALSVLMREVEPTPEGNVYEFPVAPDASQASTGTREGSSAPAEGTASKAQLRDESLRLLSLAERVATPSDELLLRIARGLGL